MHWRFAIRSTTTHTILSRASWLVKCSVLPGLLPVPEHPPDRNSPRIQHASCFTMQLVARCVNRGGNYGDLLPCVFYQDTPTHVYSPRLSVARPDGRCLLRRRKVIWVNV